MRLSARRDAEHQPRRQLPRLLPRLRGPGTRRRRVLLAWALAVASVAALPGWRMVTPRAGNPPLHVAAVAVDGSGRPAGFDAAHLPVLVPGTRVLAGVPGAAEQARRQREWLAAGTVPSAGTRWAGMVRDALLDLHVLTPASGAAVAGWAPGWRYVWPRDASFVAVALTRTGHPADAEAVLTFLQAQQRGDGLFEARYLPDSSGPPDDRGIQLDGTGWVLWAAGEVVDSLPVAQRPAFLSRLRPLLDRSTAAIEHLVSGPGHLPPPSPDYWEVGESTTTLGTAAPLLAGLRAAARLEHGRRYDPVAADAAAARASATADALEAAVMARFGARGYPRHVDGSDPDAAVAFLLPPFAPSAAPAVLAAQRAAAARMARPAGGLAPGSGWRRDGISWTPETALFALTAACSGDRVTAAHWMDWLAAHRTAGGDLPEKVLADGAPAGTAPLTWTAALVILTAQSLDTRARATLVKVCRPQP